MSRIVMSVLDPISHPEPYVCHRGWMIYKTEHSIAEYTQCITANYTVLKQKYDPQRADFPQQ